MSLDQRLEADDPEAWLVHADRLMEEGDPRGALVRDQPSPCRHRQLPAAQRQLILAHELLGPLRLTYKVPTWYRGYWHAIGEWTTVRPADYWRSVLGHPSARFLRDLEVRFTAPEVILDALPPARPPLERLGLQDGTEATDLDPWFDALPRLAELKLWRPGRFEGEPRSPLRRLSLNGAPHEATRVSFVALGERGGLAGLEALEVWGATHLGGFRWTAPLLASCRPRELTLRGGPKDDAVDVLVGWAGLRSVEQLHLGGFWPSEAGLDRLITALEARPEPLRAYTSTGGEPAPRQLAALEALAEDCEVRR